MFKKKLFTIIAAVCLCGLMMFSLAYSVADPPIAIPTLRFITPLDVDADTTLVVYSGLPNVGVGEKVYFESNEATTYSWMMTMKPDSSSADLSSMSERYTDFIPDVKGTYKVSLTITTADGTSEPVEQVINAGTWVGAGVYSDTKLTGYCALGCHSSKVTSWMETGHATMLKRNIDEGAAHYGENCIKCHTVGYNTEATAVNNGFDDIATTAGWTFPSPPAAGNWDALVADHPDLANMANIQCENCHGPGSEHNGVTTDNKTAAAFEPGVCMTCHEAAPYREQGQQWRTSTHAMVTSYPSSRSYCVECHTGAGFISKHDPDYTGDLITGYYPIGCQTCHDPHSSDNQDMLRTLESVELNDMTVVTEGGTGKLCMNCHMARRDADEYTSDRSNISPHYGPHYGTQTDILAGTNLVEYGLEMGSTPHLQVVENSCAGCHMTEWESHDGLEAIKTDFGDPGMSDELAGKLRDNLYGHSFKLKYEDEESGITYYNVKGCVPCHGEIEKFDDIKAQADHDGDGMVEGVQSEVHGLLDQLAVLLPPYNSTTPNDPDTTWTDAELKAFYNWKGIYKPNDFGVHNAAYTVGILKASINAMSTGDIGAGTIMAVTDVPNDQGKQVMVKWMRFPGDGTGDPKIVKYGVWRKAEAMAKGGIQVASRDEMFLMLNEGPGALFKVAEDAMYEFVGEVPAAHLETYSTVAATLYDSTSAGTHMTYFIVSGHGSNNTVVKSAEAGGYSVDNLAPMAPSSVAFSSTGSKVTLTWDESEAADFNYFAVYKSSSPDLSIGEDNLVGTTTETEFVDTEHNGGTYYYKVTAFDFSGNESEGSQEIQAMVTSINETGLQPDKFGLAQNYPNPFNPETVILYQLPKTAQVKLTIYNVLGQEVRTLVNANEAAGLKQIIWDSRDNRGRIVTPGVYIYKLQAGEFTAVRKMVLLK